MHLILQMAGYLGWLVGLYFASLLAWTLWKRSRPTHAQRWMRWVTRLRNFKERGTLRLAEVGMVIAAAAVVAALPMASYKYPGDGRIVELHNVRVLRDIGRYDYWFQSEQGTKFYATFCADYEPQFSGGQTLTVLKYEDRGVCWSVANTHPAYLIKRGEDGKPQKD